MPNAFKKLYYLSYSLPPCKIELNIEALLLTTIIPLVIMFLVSIVVISRKLSLSPLKF